MRSPRENTAAVASYIGGRLREVVQEGNPDVGWGGDPLLVPAWDAFREEWVILDKAFNPPQVVLRKKYEGLRDLDHRELCKKLKEAAVPRDGVVKTQLARMEARNAAIEADRQKRSESLNLEVAHALQDTSLHRKTFV